ncbi:phenylacetate--CoA ligase family protein [Inmirania thermothiophila]|uniref:Phenylacetate-CoA ligase n=1 Tax=Inmirania thermothiophila TaxID=1750597 RepID=A0A3N1Y8T5_9GAMM|nr:AMP-binding protein [Inmirania thermothiophila]ROR35219.1 phenylacetate-CoA ligase [Inmirania thermothiophila]
MREHYDELETRDPEVRERGLFSALPGLIAAARERAPAWARILAGVDPAEVTDRAALARLPVTRKSALLAMQREALPFGGLTTVAPGELARIFASPGPIYDPEGRRPDYWRMGRALFAAGFRRGEVIQNCFSYHMTPAGSMLEGGAAALGCAVIPAGVGQTELQAQVMAEVRPDGYVGTPSFLKIILEKADELGRDCSSVRKALVSAEPFPPSLRQYFAGRGITARQCYATADVGLIAYESEAEEGLIVDEGILLEIVRPGTGDPVAEGEVGEVVVTVLNPEYPLIRFGTGDLSAVMPGPSPCGRTNVRIRGWMGRADQTTKVRGMFVRPEQVAEIVRRHPEIRRARLVVDRDDVRDTMVLRCEVAGAPEGLAEAVAATIQAVTKLRGEVELVPPGSLPNDGKVIDDVRKFD